MCDFGGICKKVEPINSTESIKNNSGNIKTNISDEIDISTLTNFLEIQSKIDCNIVKLCKLVTNKDPNKISSIYYEKRKIRDELIRDKNTLSFIFSDLINKLSYTSFYEEKIEIANLKKQSDFYGVIDNNVTVKEKLEQMQNGFKMHDIDMYLFKKGKI